VKAERNLWHLKLGSTTVMGSRWQSDVDAYRSGSLVYYAGWCA